MRQVRIYVDEGGLAPGPVSIGGQAARHVLKVLRMKPGQQLVLFDGAGGEHPATLMACGRDSIELQVGQPAEVNRESSLQTRLAIAIPRGERMDFVIQKATELGVSQITPVSTERSVVRLSASRAERRRLHWQSVSASACEQCGRNSLPDIDSPRPFEALLGTLGERAGNELRLMPEPGADRSLPASRSDVTSVTLLIGPEGGFTERELDAAQGAGFQLIGLGPRILRTETAAIALLTAAQWTWGDLQKPGGA